MATRGDARESGHCFSADPFINISRAQAAGMISESAAAGDHERSIFLVSTGVARDVAPG